VDRRQRERIAPHRGWAGFGAASRLGLLLLVLLGLGEGCGVVGRAGFGGVGGRIVGCRGCKESRGWGREERESCEHDGVWIVRG
jgi:hypothetical protein